ncbi:MAG: hypothetical protein JRI23_29825 [Deltaproteobacteria bacterium]|nr:hypothetical protein [Deltaproteobacteria bacterium]
MAAWVVASCNAVLAYDEGTLRTEPTSSSGGGGAAAGGGAPTGLGGSGGWTSTTTGGGASGGAGGSGPTSCSLWPEGADSCPESQKCTVVNESTGQTQCVPAGAVPSWARCATDADCQSRLWCDHGSGVCKPICQSEGQCPAGASCVQANAPGGGAIPGLQICTAYCDPLNPLSCNQSNGTTNCLYGNLGFDCFASGTSGLLAGCSGFLSCGPPNTCHLGLCRPWCDTLLGSCTFPLLTCYGYSPPIFYDGVEVGYCSQL